LRDTHEIGGPGKTILETCAAIDASRFQLSLGVFLTRGETGDTPFVSTARQRDIPVHLIRGFNQYDPRLVTGVARLVSAFGFDIVHAHEVKSDMITYLASRLRRVPIVTTVHGWIGNSLKQRLFTALDKRVVRRFDCAIAVSARIQSDLVDSGVDPARIALLHNAIVVERYRPSGRRGFAAELAGRPLPSPLIVSIGRISPEKGQIDLIEALALLKAEGRCVSAMLVGDGPDRERVWERACALGLQDSLIMPGYVAHPERVLEEADLLVLPSHTEGLPNVVLEALAMGVPVLATRVGGTPEVILEGETGRLVVPRSPDSLARAIADFIANPAPWRQMAARGRALVETTFNFQTRTRKLEAIYARLAPGAVR